MKNPKWRCAYPGRHKVKFGGKFLTQWDGWHLTLLPSEYGTISGDNLVGSEGEICNLTAYPQRTTNGFLGYNLSGAGTIVGNTYTYANGNATAQGIFANSALVYSGSNVEHEGNEIVKFTANPATGDWIAIKVDRRSKKGDMADLGGLTSYYYYGFGNDYTATRSHNDCSFYKLGQYWSAMRAPDWYWVNAQGDAIQYATYEGPGGGNIDHGHVERLMTEGTVKDTVTTVYSDGRSRHTYKLVCPVSGQNSYFYIDNYLVQRRYVHKGNSYSAQHRWALHDGSGNFDCSLYASSGGHDIWGYAPDGFSGITYVHQYWRNYQVAFFDNFEDANAW